MIQGHRPQEFYACVGSQVKQIMVAPIDFHRALAPEVLAEIIRPIHPCVEFSANLEVAVESLLESTTPQDTLLVTGSFYLVGEVLRLLQPQ